MPATIMYGGSIAKRIKNEISPRFAGCGSLEVITVGNKASGKLYLSQQLKLANQLGIRLNHHVFGELEHQRKVTDKIHLLNVDPDVSGIIVQLPLPNNWNQRQVLATLDPRKDVDGMLYCMYYPNHLLPATAEAVITVLTEYAIPLQHQRIGLVGFTPTLNIPLALYFCGMENLVFALQAGTSVYQMLSEMDIIITATGSKWLITPARVKSGVVIVDIGITKQEDGIHGDVHPETVKKASHYSPPTRGVGPITNILIFDHLLKLHEARQPT